MYKRERERESERNEEWIRMTCVGLNESYKTDIVELFLIILNTKLGILKLPQTTWLLDLILSVIGLHKQA